MPDDPARVEVPGARDAACARLGLPPRQVSVVLTTAQELPLKDAGGL